MDSIYNHNAKLGPYFASISLFNPLDTDQKLSE